MHCEVTCACISIYNLQVIAPVQCRKGEWSCYVWDFKEKRLNILDPLINQGGSNKQDVQSRHDSIKDVLHGALIVCRSKYYNSSHGYDTDYQVSSSNEWSHLSSRSWRETCIQVSYSFSSLALTATHPKHSLEALSAVDMLKPQPIIYLFW